MLIFLGIAVFGIFTGIGLIRLRNWARISILIFSGLTVFFGGTALLVLLAIPFPINPSGPPVDPGAVKAVVLLVYGIPVLISIWWLVLFNLKGTKAQFAGTSSETSPGIPSAPACPLPVQTIAVCFLFSVLWTLVVPFLQMPFPAVFFGHPFYGTSGKVLIVLAGLLLGAGSIGLLKLKKWSYPLVLGIQGFWLRHHNHFQPNFPGADAGNAVPNAFAGKCGLRLFHAATPALLVARPSVQHPDYCNASLLSPALHGGRFRSRGTPTGLASLPILAQPNAHLCTVCHP
jgi:hypothetical protein